MQRIWGGVIVHRKVECITDGRRSMDGWEVAEQGVMMICKWRIMARAIDTLPSGQCVSVSFDLVSMTYQNAVSEDTAVLES